MAGREPRGWERVRRPVGLAALALLGLGACAPEAPPPPPAPRAVAPTLLTHGAALERIPGTAPASDPFELALRPGDFLEVIATQRGADVALHLRAPNGETAVRVDSPIGRQGEEHLAFHAREGGVYALDVEVSGAEPGGGYALRVPALRAARGEEAAAAEAATMFAQAEELRRAQRWAEAAPLYHAASLAFRARGDGEAELRAQRQLARAYRGLGDAGAEAEVLEGLPEPRPVSDWLDLARARAELGAGEAALAANHTGRRRAQAAGDLGGEARALYQIAGLLRDAGRLPAAEWAYEQAAALYARAGQPAAAATVYLALTSLYVEVGGQELAAHTLSLARAAPLAERERPFADLQAAEVARLEGRPFEARGLAEGVLAADAAPVVLDRARALLLQVARDRRDWPEAERRARERLERLPPGSEAATLALQDLGQILAYRGDTAGARRALETAQAAARRQPPRVRAAILAGLARVARAEGRAHAAWSAASEALELVEGVREVAGRAELRLAWTSDTQDFFDLAVDAALALDRLEPQAGHLERALETSERGRARGLLDELAPRRAPFGQRVALEDRRREIERRRAELIADGAPAEPLARAARELAEVVAALEALPAPDLTRLTVPTGAGARADGAGADAGRPERGLATIVRALLTAQPDLQILELDLGPDQSHLFHWSARGLTAHRLAGRAELEALAHETHTALAQSTALAAGARPAQLAAALGRALLEPVAATLRDGPILFIPDGALWLVPLGSLFLPGTDRPVLERHEIGYAPSLTALGSLARRALPAHPRVAVLADPVFQSTDPRSGPAGPTPVPANPAPEPWRSAPERFAGLARLEHSAREAALLRALVAPDRLTVVEGLAATKATLQALPLGSLDILHLATHGFFHPREPALSGLVLGLVDERGRPLDGVLRAHEIAELRLGARLVVASACSTARGRAIRGEGVVSLAHAFFRAGAAQVVVTLWPVHDEATAELMEHFYRALLVERLPPASALRRAQLAIRADPRWRAPYYWAPFVLQGDF